MNKLSLALVTLLVGLQSSPLLAHAQMVTVHENYTPFFLDGQSYKDSNGVLQANPRYDVTTKMKIKNDSVNVNMNTFHYIHFWDDSDTYLGHYANSTASACGATCIGTLPSSVSTSYAIPLPPNSDTFALGYFHYDDANYAVDGITIKEFFESETNYYDDNNLPIHELADKTLNEMYPPVGLNSLQLVTNGDFSNGTTGWNLAGETYIDTTNFNVVVLSSTGAYSAITRANFYDISKKYFFSMNILSISGEIALTDSFTGIIYNTSGYKSFVATPIQTQISIKRNTAVNAVIDDIKVFNISNLISNKTYSPLYDTTFDLMTDANIKTQMDTWVAQGLTNVNLYYYATALSYVPTLTVQQFIDYYDFYTYNRTSTFGFTPGLFTIKDDEYYANDTYEFVRNLTEIFGAGQEPLLTDLQQWETDYEQLDDYSYILPSAWHNQAITSNTYVWDDEISDTIDNSLLIIASGVIGFLTMLFGIANRNPLFHLISIGAFIVFTALFQHVAIIIIGIALMIINAMYIAGRRV